MSEKIFELSVSSQFYLALENSLCKDYVTEKFWKVLPYNVIPVVLSGANMSLFAPPHSYIAMTDFPSISKLAEYMLSVAADDALFASYFWWRQFYRVERSDYRGAYCALCAALHDSARPPAVISDLAGWWKGQAAC